MPLCEALSDGHVLEVVGRGPVSCKTAPPGPAGGLSKEATAPAFAAVFAEAPGQKRSGGRGARVDHGLVG